MRARIAVLLAGCVIPAVAHADHHAMVMAPEGGASSFGAGVSVLAAQFATLDYGGDYEAVVPAASWSMGRFVAGASVPYYRLSENGADHTGFGDVVAHGRAALFETPTVHAGIAVAVSAPTGNDMIGLGMGHVMIMPAAWGAWRHDRVSVIASAGYSRALVEAMSHHDHGPWPLVEPMNLSEITWSGGGEVAIGNGLRGGARLSGGVPIGALPGHVRVVGAARIAWTTGRVDTGAELQAGLAGDPFTIRGVVDTALRF